MLQGQIKQQNCLVEVTASVGWPIWGVSLL